MKNLTQIASFMIILWMTGCQNSKESNLAPASEEMAMPSAVEMDAKEASAGEPIENSRAMAVTDGNQSAPLVETVVNPGDKIIKTADVGLQVDNLNDARNQIMLALKAHEAYVMMEDERNETYRLSNNLQIRVPAAKFDQLLQALTTGKGITNVNYKRVNAQDVGEEFTDIQIRLKTKREVEQQYLTVLKQAKSIPNILEVQRQLGQIREEIESVEGRLRYLSNQVSFSTINLEVYQELEGSSVIERPGFVNKLKNAFKSGWNGTVNFVIFLIYLWPLWLGLAVLIILVRRWGWFRRKRST